VFLDIDFAAAKRYPRGQVGRDVCFQLVASGDLRSGSNLPAWKRAGTAAHESAGPYPMGWDSAHIVLNAVM
jgi:hypothetical protein